MQPDVEGGVDHNRQSCLLSQPEAKTQEATVTGFKSTPVLMGSGEISWERRSHMVGTFPVCKTRGFSFILKGLYAKLSFLSVV